MNVNAITQPAESPQGEAEGYVNAAQKMAADPSAPGEIQELGRVLTRILAGE